MRHETRQQLLAMGSSLTEFRSRLLVPSPAGPQPLGRIAADFQRKDFAALDPAFLAVAEGRKPDVQRFWVERCKGGSKTSDIAVYLLWLMAYSKQYVFGQVGAADAEQADEVRKAAASIARLNPWLEKHCGVDVLASAIVSDRTDSRVDILSSDALGSHGARPTVLVLDEIVHHRDAEFASTLMDNASKMPSGIVVIATNAGHVRTWQEEWRNTAIESPRWYFSAHKKPSPWLDPAELAEARRRNSANRFARLWEGQWVDSVSTAIARDDIEASVTLPAPPDGPEDGVVYVAGLDIGLVKDASALVVCGLHVGCRKVETLPAPPRDSIAEAMVDAGLWEPNLPPTKETVIIGTGRIKLAGVYVWKPGAGVKVSIESIFETILRLQSQFGLLTVGFDPHQAMHLAERLNAHGIATEQVDFTGPNLRSMCTAVLESFSERTIDLYRDETLLADLSKMRAVEKSYGMRLEFPRNSDDTGTAHGDVGTALAICTHTIKKNTWQMSDTQNRELVCSP